MSRKPAEPPPHLSERSAILWRQIVPRRAASPERQALLQIALEALDRADAAREAVERDGATWRTEKTGAIHAHPLLAVERQARQAFTRLWRQLGLDWDHNVDGRIG